MSPAVPVEPWQVWWADLDPTQGREQAKKRPVVVVSSAFHLALTAGQLVTVLPLTTVERPGWKHHVRIDSLRKPGWAITEQVRTLSAGRLDGRPIGRLTADEVAEVRTVLVRMLDVR
ncbi:type II toxin-antitoxin system PemK/MazF family toxin [Streptacidiphilus sp. N1-12]|uniref:Type II toxin-antitoxin system PemK/MazF family toxin n=2 Tax=Streptacidiphilus alkalitolerans TaxID=3342712 RepID=A0ABV6WTR9_9ACTN